MTFQVVIDGPIPQEQKPVLLRMIGENAWLLPSWVERLYINFEPRGDTISLRMTVKEEYRTVRLTVCPEWLTSEDRVRISDLQHEFIHVPLDGLHRLALQLVDLLDDEKLRAWAREEVRLASERATVDLEYALGRQP